jgi:hypothetical protein
VSGLGVESKSETPATSPLRALLQLAEGSASGPPSVPISRRKKLWPGDRFVDFDESLNTAIKKLRFALGDSPENPTFIETIPRRGYRLIAPIRILDHPQEDELGGTQAADPIRASERMESERVLPESDPDLRASETARARFPLRPAKVTVSRPKSREGVAWASTLSKNNPLLLSKSGPH